jgi:hypothetical protein
MPKKKRPVGRPPGKIQDSILHMRVSAQFIRVLDDWRRQQPEEPTRTEAVRRLVELGLTLKQKR